MNIYEGNEEYIFISYAHRDGDTVLPIVRAMLDGGFRVWFDQGIQAGTEWPAFIEEHLNRCSRVVVFMSSATVESVNCRNEINYACMLKKEILVVYLEQTVLKYGLNLQLNSKQSLFRYRHKNESSFLGELLRAKILRPCREGQSGEAGSFDELPVVANAAHGEIGMEDRRGREETIRAHQNGAYMISQVGCIGCNDPDVSLPKGEYSEEISLDRFSVVQFHCRLLQPVGMKCKKQIGLRVYNENGALVFENFSSFSFSKGSNKFSISWVVRDRDGFNQMPGQYTALVWIDDSRAFEFSFRLVRAEKEDPPTSAEKKRARKRNAPKLFGWHLVTWGVYFGLLFFIIKATAMIPILLFLVLSFVMTGVYFSKTKKLGGYSGFASFLLTWWLPVSFYYGIYLFFMTIYSLVSRLSPKNRF